MQSLRLKVRAKFEAFLLRVAKYIVRGRNIPRAMVVSRADNNWMFEMGYELEKIARRIEGCYENEPAGQ